MTELFPNDPMSQGFLDGFSDDRPEYPESLSNRGARYRHGWLNGRDDREKRVHWKSFQAALDAAAQAEVDDGVPVTSTKGEARCCRVKREFF